MATGHKECAVTFADGIQFPDDASQAGVGLAGDAVIEVGVAREAEEAAAVVRSELTFAGFAVEEAALLHAEAVTVVT